VFQWLNDFKASAAQSLARFNNSTFRDAAMACCALVAASDGKVDASEKTKVANLIGANEMLKVFNAVELRATFEKFCEMAGDDFARLDLLSAVRKLKTNAEQAEYALKVALIIANADGSFSDSEKRVVKELCDVLGLPASSVAV
jgi:tellurite resistance protein TerB